MKMSIIIDQIPQQLREEIMKSEPVAALIKQNIPLSQIMLAEETYQSIFHALRFYEKHTLRIIVCKFAAQPFDLLSLQAARNAAQLSGAEVAAGLVGLQRKGIIYAIHKHWGENSFCLPVDLLAIWQKLIMEPTCIWEEIGDHDVGSILDVPPLVLNNLFCFLNYLEHQHIKLTRKAEIPKRDCNRILQQLQWKENCLTLWELKREYILLYPISLSLTMDIAERLDLIRWSKTSLSLCRANLHRWLQLSKVEMNQQIFQLFCNLYVPSSAADEHFLTKMYALSSQKWYLLEDFTAWLQEYDIIIMFSDWLVFCEAFGWIEQGFAHESRPIFRLRLNREKTNVSDTPIGKFHVQSDYEILVPPDVSFAIRWELTYLSDHIHTEQVGVYRLTQPSLLRAIHSGRSLEHCIEFLTEHSLFGVPDSVINVLLQWAQVEVSGTEQIASIDEEELHNSALEIFTTKVSYDWVTKIPSRDEVYPLWQTIPPLWWKACRVYHASTRKEIAQLAIKWKASLKLSDQHKEWNFIPKQVIESDKCWHLEGWVESVLVSYSQDQWSAMQLILTGFDDLINLSN
ncbi:MAG: helicase-associated domain-containing protein [Paenibacillaceae bacterium]